MQDLADVKGGRVINPAVGDGGVNYVDGAETHLLGSHVYKWPRPAYTEEEACLNSEAKYLDVLRHPYIVSYHGRCIDPSQTDPDQQGKRGLILERMDTDLLKLIKKG